MRESVQGAGKLCGGVFLDEGFIRLMRNKVGITRWATLSPKARKKFLNDEWEHGIKRHYDGRGEADWEVLLPAEAEFQMNFNRTELDLTK